MVKTPSVPLSFLDFSFRTFVTPKLIQIIYVLAIVAAGILALITFLACVSLPSIFGSLFAMTRGGYGGDGGGASAAGVLLGFVMSPIVFVLFVVGARVVLETAIALFRIADNTEILAKR